jgi:sec-independent protein translocase protein TatB
MFLGLTIEKLLLFGLVAALLIGPERLPRYAEALAAFTRRARDWISTARTRMREEMGEDFEDVDWRTLDPRQYDPRRIIREALLDDAPVAPPKPVTSAAAGAAASVASPFRGPGEQPRFRAGDTPPVDLEAT